MKRGLKMRLVIAVCVALALTLTACAPKAPPVTPPPTQIVLGLIAPLTGDVATFGKSTKEGVDLAIKQANDAGGVNGMTIVLKVEDDKNDAVEGANAAKKLINQDKVHAIIGSVASKVTLAIGPITQESKIPHITPTSTNEAVTLIGDYVFRACFIDPFQGLVMAKFATENLKGMTAAILFDIGNDYTKGLSEEFRKHYEAMGGTVVAYETYAAGDQDFNAQLTKIKNLNPAILFLPDYYNTVGLITKQARAQGITAQFLGADGWDSAELVPIAGDSIEGGFFSNHYSPDSDNPASVAFRAAYEAAYKSTPDALAALAFDATNLMINAIKNANSLEGAKIRDALAATKDFKAVSGSINFDAVRNPIKGAVVLTIKDGKMVFEAAINP